MSLYLMPINLREARAFVDRVHRHHPAPQGGKFAVAAASGDQLVGVAIVGRCVAKALDDGWTAEVTRVATDGTKNACSMLYGACWRAARAMGYRRVITYTGEDEPGTSLLAAGFRIVGQTDPRSWNRRKRPRTDRHEIQGRFRWERSA